MGNVRHALSIFTGCIKDQGTVVCRTVSIGMANPTPAEDPVGVKMAVLTPMTRPALSSRGPPEFPGLMLASVDRG